MIGRLLERPTLWGIAAVVLVSGGGPVWAWLLCLFLFVATLAGRDTQDGRRP